MNTKTNASFVEKVKKGISPDVLEMVRKTVSKFVEDKDGICTEAELRALASIAITGRISSEFVDDEEVANTLKRKALAVGLTYKTGIADNATISGVGSFLDSGELGPLGEKLYLEAKSLFLKKGYRSY